MKILVRFLIAIISTGLSIKNDILFTYKSTSGEALTATFSIKL